MKVSVGGLFEGEGLLEGLFKLWHFSQWLTNKQHNFLNQLTLSNCFVRAFLKYDIIVQLCFPRIWPLEALFSGDNSQNRFLMWGSIGSGMLILGRALELASSLGGKSFPVYKFQEFYEEQKCYVCKQSNFPSLKYALFFADLAFS